MNNELMIDWLKTVWLRRPGALRKLPSILVMDAFKGHLTDDVKNLLRENKSTLVTIPGGMTSQLQPLDVCINKPFKDRVRKLYTDWLTAEDREVTPTGRIKRANASQLATWVSVAWKSIPQELISKSFRKCCISNSLDGSEDDALWSDSEKEESCSEASEGESE